MPPSSAADVVLRVLDALERHDGARVRRLLHPALEAPDDVRLCLSCDVRGARRVELDAHRVEAAGEEVLVHGRVRSLAEGCLTDSPACWRITVRDLLVRRVEPVGAAAPVALA